MSSSGTRVLVLMLVVAVAVVGLAAAGGRARAQDGERLITLDLRDATLDDALRLIFRSTPYSYVLAPGVTGRVTLTLNNVTFTQALRAILDMHNLTYRREAGNVYYITQKLPEQVQPQFPIIEEVPAARMKIYWFGPGGRYEIQYLDSRVISSWFGGWEAYMGIIPYDAEGGAGGGGVGGAGGGRAGGGGAAGGGGGRAGGGGAAGGGGGRAGGGGGGGGARGGGGGRAGGGGTTGGGGGGGGGRGGR